MSAGQPRRGGSEDVEVALAVGGDEQQELPGRGAERSRAAGDDLPHPRTGRQRQVERLPTGPLPGCERRGQLHERQRVARRRVDHGRGDRRDHIRGHLVEDGPCRADRQRPDPHDRHPGTPSVALRVAGGEDDGHSTASAPGREPDAFT